MLRERYGGGGVEEEEVKREEREGERFSMRVQWRNATIALQTLISAVKLIFFYLCIVRPAGRRGNFRRNNYRPISFF